MAGPIQPTAAAAKSVDVPTLVVLLALGMALVAGYVVLAALGRDVSGYVLFLGGPAVTGIVGVILNKRVTHVQAAVDATTVETKALVAETVSAVDDHLHEQDKTLSDIAAATASEPVAKPDTVQQLPTPRDARSSPWGPIASGLLQSRRASD